MSIVPRTGATRRSELEVLTDAEIADLAISIAEQVDDGGVDVAGVREVLSDWALVSRVRNRPDHEHLQAAYRRAVEAP
jgi:23S rRNA G2445 N2-methylase RlmL